uniref:Uncharacterized protein n=1 Tax=Ditylenchus dipsaci TaxID=166011 RepID=A0A915EQC5_9BILA
MSDKKRLPIWSKRTASKISKVYVNSGLADIRKRRMLANLRRSTAIHYSLIAPRLKIVYCLVIKSQKAGKNSTHQLHESPDYPEDLELKLSGYKKVMEDILSLSDREVSEQLNLLPKEEAKR